MPTVLVVVDGIGLADPAAAGNAVTPQTLPILFGAMSERGFATLEASGPAVGLDPGQAGNSEVGHVTIGAGFVTPSALARIDAAFEAGALAANPVFARIGAAPRLHLVGLVSGAGTHGHVRTIERAAVAALENGVGEVVLHLGLDGVDSPAGSAPDLLRALFDPLSSAGRVRVGSVIGRRWMCDRSGDLAITRVVVDAVEGRGAVPAWSDAALAAHLSRDGEASFPAHRGEAMPRGPGEPVLLTANRADRAVQVARLLAAGGPVYAFVALGDVVPEPHVLFPTRPLDRGLAFALGERGLVTARVAETCKYPHVTYFLDGRNEFTDGTRVCLPSLPEAALATTPQMRAAEIADAVVGLVHAGRHDLVVGNIANMDQIGHLGRLDVARDAAVHVDRALARIADACRACGWTLLVTSDHGNADRLVDDAGRPFGSHTTAPTPLAVLPADGGVVRWRAREGSLANLAATVLATLGVPAPSYMASSLVEIA
ncbi:hypothetical protein [Salinarimonas chemoclinalis]|uniref:hypothetical protein n=1 Tax=Salinarimonas chemoclinalis TaxID=3241599 RepID=UPI0035573FF0